MITFPNNVITCTRIETNFKKSPQKTVVSYHESWKKVHSLLLHKSNLLVFYGKGIFMFNLDTQVSLTVVPESSGYIPRDGYVYKDGFLDHRLYFWQNSQITRFAGDSEGGSRDGTVQFARFYKISGICVEFDHDYATCRIYSNVNYVKEHCFTPI